MKRLLSALLVLALASCIAVVKQPPSNNPPPPRNNPPPPPQKPPGYEGDLKLKYDASLDDCFDASRKVMGIMKLTEVDQNKKNGVISGQFGPVFGRCTMYRKNHHTYVTYYFRVNGGDARTPHDYAKNAHNSLGKQLKETGRDTD
jgi:hypothetical protein